jgi:hypothetical protein
VHFEDITGKVSVSAFNELDLRPYLELYKSSGALTDDGLLKRRLVIDQPAIWPSGITK